MSFTSDQVLETYRRMERIRSFEEAAQELYLGGKIPGACHCSIGQEAAIVGACMALRDNDYITGTHRSHGHPIGKGAKLKGLMAELMGKVTGICKGRGGSMHLADNSVGIVGESAIVGGGIPLATGCGMSAQGAGLNQVSLCFFGDGASNQGTFHESINMAAIWKLPVIYFCENNGYAITTSVENSHAQPDIAKRAYGYDIPGIIVDGQDVEAVYEVTKTAVERARNGEGPTLIEAKTYRFDEHNVGLDIIGDPYRSDTEIQDHINNKDPIKLFKTVMLSRGVNEEVIQEIQNEVRDVLAEAISFAEQSPFPEASDLYKYMFSNPINYPATVPV